MLRLEIVTPEKRVVDAEVDSVTVPTLTGEAGIFPSHAPLVSALKPGILSYAQKGNSERLAVSGGFIEVSRDVVSVLVDSAETSEEIDVSAARASLDSAEKSLSSQASVEDNEKIREALDHAAARIQLAGG
jgi:F-type H+-transporting ATPase subunit epsilon